MKWPLVKLGDAVSFRGGGTPRKDNPDYWTDEIPWATVKDFKSLRLCKTQDSISAEGLESSASNLIPAGHVIIPTRMALGKAAINTIDLAINQDLRALIPKQPLDPTYLLHSMLGLADIIERNGSGATVKGITQAKLSELQIPLPPLAQQKRIAGILDAVDALRAKRRESLAQLDTLLQSTFLDMFGDPVTNPMGWKEVAVADLCESSDDVRCGPFGTQLHQHEFTDSGVPLWGIKHVNAGFAFHTDEFVSDTKAASLVQYSIIPGDLVMTRKGTIGNCHIYPGSLEPGIMHSDLLRLRLSPTRANAQFVCSQFAYSRNIQRQLELMSPGAVMPGINVTKLKKLEVEAPPLDLQHRFAAIVESVEQQKGRQRAHLDELDTLFASLQSRAFRGDL